MSPGAALVFLLVGPATNIASLSVLVGLLGRKAVGIYLCAIAGVSVLAGLFLDQIYSLSGITARAVVGSAAEIIPLPLEYAAALLLVAVSVRPLKNSFKGWYLKVRPNRDKPAVAACGCSGGCEE